MPEIPTPISEAEVSGTRYEDIVGSYQNLDTPFFESARRLWNLYGQRYDDKRNQALEIEEHLFTETIDALLSDPKRQVAYQYGYNAFGKFTPDPKSVMARNSVNGLLRHMFQVPPPNLVQRFYLNSGLGKRSVPDSRLVQDESKGFQSLTRGVLDHAVGAGATNDLLGCLALEFVIHGERKLCMQSLYGRHNNLELIQISPDVNLPKIAESYGRSMDDVFKAAGYIQRSYENIDEKMTQYYGDKEAGDLAFALWKVIIHMNITPLKNDNKSTSPIRMPIFTALVERDLQKAKELLCGQIQATPNLFTECYKYLRAVLPEEEFEAIQAVVE